MNVKCKMADADYLCPHGLDTCCGVCDQFKTCKDACTSSDVHNPTDCDLACVFAGDLATLDSAVPGAIETITKIMVQKKHMEEQETKLKKALLEAMEKCGVKSFENDQIKITYVAPTTRTAIDSAKLKKDLPAIAEQYSKVSNVSASVRVVVK